MRIQWGRYAAIMLVIMFAVTFIGCQSTSVRSAKIYMQQDDPENAKDVLLEGAEVSPNDAELWYVLGKVHAELDEWTEMDAAFKKAQDITSSYDDDIENTRYENWRLKYNAAVAPFNDGDYEQTIEILLTALIIKPSDPETHKRLGLSYLQTDQFSLAEMHLLAAIAVEEEDEKDVSSRRNLLLLYWQQEDFEKVISTADDLLALDAFNGEMDEKTLGMKSDTIQKKALSLQQLDRTDEAIVTWDSAIDSSPSNPDFYYNKAILLHSMENYSAAAEAYLKSIELNPDDNEARLNAARALLGMEQYPTILEVLEPWLFPEGVVSEEIIVHDNTDAYMLLRAAYLNLGMEDKADILARILANILEQGN
jgi:tetratricopeptide (TPR) repeat protein